MKRLLLVSSVLVALVALTFVLVRGGSDDAQQVAEPMPYPRSVTPLPVPEMIIGQGPWKDPLPAPRPRLSDGALLEGFVGCGTGTGGTGGGGPVQTCKAD